ncbi:MAG TPA: hypothetical protein VKV20_16015 [Ktedonobacteraceae bacterium]|nr:hypothetical protein [Ktedonobacteraceae bacterium]
MEWFLDPVEVVLIMAILVARATQQQNGNLPFWVTLTEALIERLSIHLKKLLIQQNQLRRNQAAKLDHFLSIRNQQYLLGYFFS